MSERTNAARFEGTRLAPPGLSMTEIAAVPQLSGGCNCRVMVACSCRVTQGVLYFAPYNYQKIGRYFYDMLTHLYQIVACHTTENKTSPPVDLSVG